MKKQVFALALTLGIAMLPVAASAAEQPSFLQAHTSSTITPAATTSLGTYYYSPSIGQEEPTALTFQSGVSTQLQLNVTQSTLALNTPSVQLKLYSGGLLVSSQTAYGSGSGTFYFSLTPGKSYYVNVKNTGTCQVNGSFAAYLN